MKNRKNIVGLIFFLSALSIQAQDYKKYRLFMSISPYVNNDESAIPYDLDITRERRGYSSPFAEDEVVKKYTEYMITYRAFVPIEDYDWYLIMRYGYGQNNYSGTLNYKMFDGVNLQNNTVIETIKGDSYQVGLGLTKIIYLNTSGRIFLTPEIFYFFNMLSYTRKTEYDGYLPSPISGSIMHHGAQLNIGFNYRFNRWLGAGISFDNIISRYYSEREANIYGVPDRKETKLDINKSLSPRVGLNLHF